MYVNPANHKGKFLGEHQGTQYTLIGDQGLATRNALGRIIVIIVMM
jgi:hypothetical protein